MNNLITVLQELDKLIYEETKNKQSIKIILPRAVQLKILNYLQIDEFKENIFIESNIRKFNLEVEDKWLI